MKKKKIIVLVIIFLFILSFVQNKVFAFKEKNTNEKAVISYINMDWWKDFNDPYLTEYIIKAIQCNNDIKLAELKVEETKENKNIKRANEMPSVGIGAVPALYKLPSLTNSDGLISLPIYANYELDLFGKNRDRTKSMDKSLEIAWQNERAAYISTISAAGSVYYNIVKLDKLIEIQQQIIDSRKQIYNLMFISNEQGFVSTSDTVFANKSFIEANSEMAELKKSQEKMLNLLAVLIGDMPENSKNYARISFDDLEFNKSIPEFITSDVTEQRPDLIAAEKMIEKTGLEIKAAKKDFLPSFNIFGLISFNSTEYLSKMNWTNSLAILGGGALLPLFSGGKKIANLKLQKNKYNQAFENYRKTYLTSVQEINDALCSLKLDYEKYQKTLESYELDEKDFYYTNLKYNEGIISNLDLLQKKENLLTVEKRLAQEKSTYYINQISLYKASAGML